MKLRLLLLAVPLFASLAARSTSLAADPKRNLVTDEPRGPKGNYVPVRRPGDGQHLALTLAKLENGFDPPRPFLIWALGSSYCNMLGNGEAWQTGSGGAQERGLRLASGSAPISNAFLGLIPAEPASISSTGSLPQISLDRSILQPG